MVIPYNTSAVYISGLCFLRALCERCVPQRPTSRSVLFWFMKDIPWYEWLYAITENGRVWSYPKKWTGWHNGIWRKHVFISWYPAVNLCDGKKWYKIRTIHRLLGITYIPNPNNLPLVLHWDNNPLNTHVSNLRWWTHKENIQQAHKDWLCQTTQKHIESARKTGYANRKPILQFTKEWVFINEYISAQQASLENWIKFGWISKCCTCRIKAYRWFIWKFKNQEAKENVEFQYKQEEIIEAQKIKKYMLEHSITK